MTDTAPDAFPWLKHLDADDREELLRDLADTTCIADLNQTVHAWSVTALALSDPDTRAALTAKAEPGGNT
ncbi:hypothetical protein OH810_31755 (plasmid) [Streptomyces albidoflavus]|uniref:hypothetical protein n=1 Tax=Streptomyces albidoflavus TaxID=1886 RepID=UPI002F915203|nr:hypothetical protein OH810_31755 [Streptomyces albidoflavus]